MVMGGVIEVDIRQIIAAFENLRRLDTKKVLSDLRGPARFDQRHHWNKSEAPDGRWERLAASTIARRKRKRGIDRKSGRNRNWPKKIPLGRFPTALKSTVSAQELVVASRVKRFSRIHNEGGMAGKRARIPQRQFLWISKWLIGQVRSYFERALERHARMNRGGR